MGIVEGFATFALENDVEEDNYDSNLKETEDESIEIGEIGISVRDLKNNDYLNFDLEKNTTGVVVTETSNEEILTKIGDVIIEINREKITNSEQFLNLVLEIKEKGRSSILLRVIRDKKAIWITLKYLKQ